jgi:ActR/RegA family two-component response regulator
MPTTVERILLVDDEQAVLDGLCRQHRKRYTLISACGAGAGLKAITEQGPFAVVVTDYKMPRINGTQFLAKVMKFAPDTVRIMLTGQADLRTAIDAVNRGHIFRFLAKPCEPDVFRAGLDAALEQYQLRHAERFLLEQTVRGSIEVMAEVLAIANPTAFGRAIRVRRYVQHIVATLKLSDAWQYETAALLSQIGCVSIPNDILDRILTDGSLPPEQVAMVERHPQIAHDLIKKIPRLQTVAEIVRHQRAGLVTSGEVDGVVVMGARILCAALGFEELIARGAVPQQALRALHAEGRKFERRILDALASAEVFTESTDVRLVSLSQLQVGMILQEDVRNCKGMLLVTPGHELSEGSLQRLRNYATLKLLTKTEFRVRMPTRADWPQQSCLEDQEG